MATKTLAPPPSEITPPPASPHARLAAELARQGEPALIAQRTRLEAARDQVATLTLQNPFKMPGRVAGWLPRARAAAESVAIAETMVSRLEAGPDREPDAPGGDCSGAIVGGTLLMMYVQAVGPESVGRLVVALRSLTEKTEQELAATRSLVAHSIEVLADASRPVDLHDRCQREGTVAIEHEPALQEKLDGQRAALELFEGTTLGRSVRQVIDDAGGVEAVAGGLRIARTIGDAPPLDDDPVLVGLRGDLAAVEKQVSDLAGSVARGLAPDEAAAELKQTRATMTSAIRQRIDARRAQLQADRLEACRMALDEVRPEVEAATSGDSTAWRALVEAAQARPDAFTDGFAGRLIDAAAVALADAGAVEFSDALRFV